MQFITRQEALNITGSELNHEPLNEFGTRIYNKAVEDTIKRMPDLMARLMVSVQAQKKMVDDFYKRNPELKEHAALVVKKIQEVDSRNPEKNYSEILKEAETLIKKELGVQAKADTLKLDKPTEVKLNGNGVL